MWFSVSLCFIGLAQSVVKGNLFVAHQVVAGDTLSIIDFGGIPNDYSNEACYANSAAFELALNTANASQSTVMVPLNMDFCIFTFQVQNLHNISLQVEGSITVSNNITEWTTGIQDFIAAINFVQCRYLTIHGNGLLNGQGHDWWWAHIIKGVNRPHLLFCSESEDVLIFDLHFQNSPKFHCRVYDVHRLHIHNIDVYVDTEGQKKMLQANQLWKVIPSEVERPNKYGLDVGGVPVFPINTDGIDVSGYDMLIEDCTIQNFDDAVVVKPTDGNGYWSACSHNINVRNISVIYSVGMSIGSISPGTAVPCISDVVFQDITFQYPFKAVYIKTNPGTVGTGIVSNITYRDIQVHGTSWYPIWIGPQQETTGPGEAACSFLYPISQHCPTQPLISISDITLDNISFTGSLLMPGVILGNETNPIRDLVFNSISNKGKFIVQDQYVCEGTEASITDSTPIPNC